MVVDPKDVSLATLPSDSEETKPLKIGIVGFGAFGQFLARRMSQNHQVSCIDKVDKVSLCKFLIVCKRARNSPSSS
jgi:phosphoglycerate dehydrogenase-like enzyme